MKRLDSTFALTMSAFVALAAGSTLPVRAEGPATIRGTVYSCSTHAPVGRARVLLHGLDDGTNVALTANESGRFTKVGLAPGRYVIAATPPLPPEWDKPWNQHGAWTNGRPYQSFTSSRMARLETDDVLEMRIGTRPPAKVIDRLVAQGERPPGTPAAANDTQPHPACDTALIPLAPTTSSRYIIH